VEDEGDAAMIGEGAEDGGAGAAQAEGEAEKRPDIVPTLPGTSSCASTRMAENAEARMIPMIALSTAHQKRVARRLTQTPYNWPSGKLADYTDRC
jgi:hypothetical protein